MDRNSRAMPLSLSASRFRASFQRDSLNQCNLEPVELSLELPHGVGGGQLTVSGRFLSVNGDGSTSHPWCKML